jgi:nicotinate-nucleotide pyrophosphorylase
MNWAADESISQLIALARREDLGSGDVTSALMPNGDAVSEFALVAKQPCVLSGRAVASEILAAYDSKSNAMGFVGSGPRMWAPFRRRWVLFEAGGKRACRGRVL